MKINENKIKSYQAGGQFMTYQPLPLIPQQPAQQAPVGPPPTDDNGGRILDDDTFKALLGKGVTNDVMAYQDSLTSAEREYSRMSDIEKNTARGQRLRSTLKGDLGTINMLMRNKSQFDDSVSRAKDNGALGEYAVTNRGMVVKDLTTNKLQEVSYDDYSKDLRAGDKRKYQALTNAQLINEREYNHNLVGDDKTFEALNTGVGMDKVKQEVLSVLATISNGDSQKMTKNGYLSIQNEKAASGAQKLLGDAQQGVYDVTSMTSDTNNASEVKLAMDSMWQNLSTNAKSVLRARAATQGVTGDKIDDIAKASAMSLLAPKQQHSHEESVDSKYNNEMSLAMKGGKETESMGPWEALVSGSAANDTLTLNSGTNKQLVTKGSQMPGFFDGNKLVGRTSITNIKGLMGIGDLNSVTVGDSKVAPSNLDSIVYDGGKIAKVPLPYKTDKNGGVSPDFELADKLNKAKDEMSKLPATSQTATAKEAIYEKYGIPTDGKGGYYVPEKVFITFNAYTNSGVVGDHSELLTNESKGDNKKSVEALYKSEYLYGGKDNDPKAAEIKRPEYHSWMPFSTPDVLKGMVYIPVNNDIQGARYIDGNSTLIPKRETTADYYHNENSINKPVQPLVENRQPSTPMNLDYLKNYNKPQ